MINNEIWKNLDFNPNYAVSNLGNVRTNNYRCTGKPRVISQRISKHGYLRSTIYSLDNKRLTVAIHRLVANAFIPTPTTNPDGTVIVGKLTINHIDGNKSNNCVDNLEYCDIAYNIHHAMSIGIHSSMRVENKSQRDAARTKAINSRKKQVCCYDLDDNIIAMTNSVADMGDYIYNIIHKSTISAIKIGISSACRGERETAYGYKFKYIRREI